MAAECGVELLGALPLDAMPRCVRKRTGEPRSVISAPGTPRAAASSTWPGIPQRALARRGRDRRGQFPQIVVEET